MKKITYILSAAFLLSGCVKVDVYNTDHPAQGRLTLELDWSARSEGTAVPASITVAAEGATTTFSSSSFEYSNLLDAGTYTLYVYSAADRISVSGTTATVATEGTGVAARPDHQFFGSLTRKVEQDADYSERVAMRQLTGEVSFGLTIAQGDPADIASITAVLDGVASAWDCVSDAPSGAATTVVPVFTISGNKALSSVRLLGVAGDVQSLTLIIDYSNGRPQQTVVQDLTAQFASFNTSKLQPLNLGAQFNTPADAEISGTITDWTVVDHGIVTPETPSYSVGDYYPDPKDAATAEGLIIWIDDPNAGGYGFHGKIVSLDEGQRLMWNVWAGDYGATSASDGATNTAAIATIIANNSSWPAFEAYQWCIAKGTGWYFPAIDELTALYAAYNADRTAFDAKLTAAGGKAISAGEYDYYWSSTEVNSSCVWDISFVDGSTRSDRVKSTRSASIYVRAAKAF